MITLLLHLLRLFPFLFGGHRQLAVENLALRQQLAVYKRTTARPKLRTTDRLFWIWLARVWAGWRQALVIVTPDTVLRWQRRRFREYWTKLSGGSTGGRPAVHAEIKALITRMANANPLWGAPRIHGELLKLGLAVAERTVSRLMPKLHPGPLRPGGRSSPTMSRPRLPRFLHGTHHPPARALRSRRARPPSPPRRPLQRDRASHRRLDCPAARRHLPRRLRPALSPPRSRRHLRGGVPPTSHGHGDP